MVQFDVFQMVQSDVFQMVQFGVFQMVQLDVFQMVQLDVFQMIWFGVADGSVSRWFSLMCSRCIQDGQHYVKVKD